MRVSLLSLIQNKWSSATISVCVALVVLVLIAFLSMAEGYEYGTHNAGSPAMAVLTAAEASAESDSRLSREQVELLAAAPNVPTADGEPLISPELVMTVGAARKSDAGRVNIGLRGMRAIGSQMREGFHLLSGRMFEPGRNEIIVGARLSEKLGSFELGKSVRLAGRDWLVVGVFALTGDLFEFEAWGDIAAIQAAYDRLNQYQSVRMKLADDAALLTLATFNAQDPRLRLGIQTEQQFFRRQTEGTHNLMTYLGWPLAAVLAVGAIGGTFNALSISVDGRRRSLRILGILGFHHYAVFACVLAEAMLLALIGSLAGIAVAWSCFDGLKASTMGAGFTSISFEWRVGAASIVQALLLSAVLGLLGGLIPAWRAVVPVRGGAS
jgi:putative ABC transport system permease protein